MDPLLQQVFIEFIQAYDSVICGYFCIVFIYYLFKGKILTD